MDKKLYWASVVLGLIGLAVAIYMTIYKLTSNDNMCLGSGDCSTVNASPYSEVYGIPVAAIGVMGYLAILICLFLETRFNFFKQNATLLIFGLGMTGFVFNAYLIYLEFFEIKALCPFCLTSQIAMIFLFALAIIRLVRQPVS